MAATLPELLVKIRSWPEMSASDSYRAMLSELAELERAPGAEGRLEFADELRRAFRWSAPMLNLADALAAMGDRDFSQQVGRMLLREERSAEMIAARAVDEIRGARVMTLSWSSTVAAALEALARARGVSVIVAESAPMMEGRLLAQRLSRSMRCDVVKDGDVREAMGLVDAVVCGADHVSPFGAVNKKGTLAMALAAHDRRVPVNVLCAASKIRPEAPVPTGDQELVPLRLLRAVVTEDGPADLGALSTRSA